MDSSAPPHLTEGDVNLGPRRRQFQAQHNDQATRDWLDRDQRVFLHQSLSTPCLNMLDGSEGSWLVDHAQRRILDFHGNSVHQVGFGHPHVVNAVKQQLDQLPFCPRRYTNQAAIELAERLVEMAPLRRAPATTGSGEAANEATNEAGDDSPRVLFAPGGTAAIGIAMKLVRYATGRFKTVSMWDSFHGASLDAVSLGGEALFREDVGPLLPGCIHVPPYGAEGLERNSVEYVEYVLDKERDVAAVIAEPMRWTTVVPPPADYWPRIRAACDRHGALLVIDEIPACLGRTGAMFCCENFGIEPDILVIGKGLGGGIFPMAAVLARGGLNIAGNRALGHYTHEKSSVGAAAALATLEVIEQEGLLDRACKLGEQTRNQLRNELAACPLVHEVRGMGLQFAIELRRDGRPAVDEAEAVLYHCLELGLSFKVSDGNVLVMGPPLTITDEEMQQAIKILVQAITAAAG